MKNSFYLVVLCSITVSCDMTKMVYDDVYDAAEVKSISDDGYEDLIKANEKDHKVVVDKEESVSFGGYYPSNQSGGTSFSSNNCNCMCDYGRSVNWFYTQPSWIYGNLFQYSNACSCGHWNNNWNYHALSFGNPYNNYGYFDYWGGWHPYYPWDYDPYGFYSFYYGYNYYSGYNSNNTIWGNIFNGTNSGSNDTYAGGNHFYGHRSGTTTGSSNTTTYSHTVRGGEVNTPSGGLYSEEVQVEATETFVGNTTRPSTSHVEMSAGEAVYAGDNSQTNRPTTHSNGTATTAGANTETFTSGTTTTPTTHVVATNQFEAKYPPAGTSSKTGSGQTTTTYNPNPVSTTTNPGNSYTKYPTNTNTQQTHTTSTSRNSESNYNTTTTYQTNQNSGSSNTTNGHRTTTSTTSGSGGSTTSGSSRTTTTSRR